MWRLQATTTRSICPLEARKTKYRTRISGRKGETNRQARVKREQGTNASPKSFSRSSIVQERDVCCCACVLMCSLSHLTSLSLHQEFSLLTAAVTEQPGPGCTSCFSFSSRERLEIVTGESVSCSFDVDASCLQMLNRKIKKTS